MNLLRQFNLISWLLVSCSANSVESLRAEQPPASKTDSAIHVPTPPDVVEKMLAVAKITTGDLLYDLGCGDGRIVIAAAAKYGCRAVGFDIDARKVQQSKENVQREGLADRVRIEHQDIFKLDLRAATVVTLYLLPEMNNQLVPQLEKMKDGSRIVCHEFPLQHYQHDSFMTVKSQQDGVPRDVYLYRLPLKKK